MFRSCTCLWMALAAAPVASLTLKQQPLLSDMTPSSSSEFDDKAIDKWDEEQLKAYMTNWSPSPELVSAWSKAWELDQAEHLKQTITREAMSAAVGECSAFVSATFRNIKDAAKHVGKYCADPWFETKKCSESYHIPGYRLGDLITGNARAQLGALEGFMRTLFPESIAAKFLQKNPGYRKLSQDQRYTELHKLINGPDYAGYERPSASDVVVHVRAGDAVKACGGAQLIWNDTPMCGKHGPEVKNMVKGQKYWEGVISSKDWSNITRVILVTGDHMRLGNSTTPNSETDEYMLRISELFADKTGSSIELRKNGNADCDFVYMASTGPSNLIHSGGGYDKLIVEMVKRGDTEGESVDFQEEERHVAHRHRHRTHQARASRAR